METDDPRTWAFDPTRRLWLDDHQGRFALVDFEDYLWAVRWRWQAKVNKNGKLYACRSTSTYNGGKQSYWIYLHVAIMERSEPRPKWAEVCDHINGDSLNCRRENLRWATFATNRRNINGQHALRLPFEGGPHKAGAMSRGR